MDRKALETARRTVGLARELGIEHLAVADNTLQDDRDRRELHEYCHIFGNLVSAPLIL